LGSFEALHQALPQANSSRTGGDLDGEQVSRADPRFPSASPGAAATPDDGDGDGEWDATALRMSLGQGVVQDDADAALAAAEVRSKGAKRRTGRCKFFNAQKVTAVHMSSTGPGHRD
jgi:hypothetical protein